MGFLLLFSALNFALLLGLTSALQKTDYVTPYDNQVQGFFSKRQLPTFLNLVALLTEPKIMVIWDALLALLCLVQDVKLALFVLSTLALTDLLGIGLKNWVKRKRPATNEDERAGYSYPSGHTLGSMIFSLNLLVVVHSPLTLLVDFALIALVAWSRLGSKNHYASDLLAACLLALTVWPIVYACLIAAM